ncbi:methyltransferase [Paraburkholderia ginsengiterrae]|uniref:Methyltransferase n=1 Tax=Paraburkholderia ginsengiterrae TaxID=1462993 RepID=A0A1A9NCI8_9BURK|nr:class I SAM-dependent methyltransferase [Paraburkholderia ginsengiterrae]OAJ58706.1 methyltransferase [Paraburkholderia ginsengiterrae]OAJ63651.1 methyltransferase [Paraburkholderia ginsengiterrae]
MDAMNTPSNRHARALRATLTAWSAALLLAACAGPSASVTASADPALLEAAVSGPQRGDKARVRDVYRHPEETLQFFELAPSQSVLEIEPGGGWYTDILAPYLHDHGKLYEAQYDGPQGAPSAEEQSSRAAFARKLAATPAIYGNVVVGTLHAGQFSGFPADASVDRVLTFRNIHNWIKDGQIDANLRAFYAALKPGGMLGVEEHRAAPGTSLQQTIDSGYVTEAYVIEHARAAGFELAGQSEVNSNPRDTKNYPNGVWSLPPTYRGGEVDRAKYAAIGESDRMTLRFVKPAH